MKTQTPVTELSADPVYRPICTTAVLSTIAGLLALLAAVLVYDLGSETFLLVSAVGIFAGFRGLSTVRRYDMAGRGLARAGLGFSVLALGAGFCINAYQAAIEVPKGCRPISYEPLQPKPGEQIPATAQALHGQKIFIKGYMYPSSQSTGIREFVLCRDNGTCCFGGQPKLTDMIEVKLKEPLALDFHSGLRHVAGTFRVEPNNSPGALGSVLYHLDADYAR